MGTVVHIAVCIAIAAQIVARNPDLACDMDSVSGRRVIEDLELV